MGYLRVSTGRSATFGHQRTVGIPSEYHHGVKTHVLLRRHRGVRAPENVNQRGARAADGSFLEARIPRDLLHPISLGQENAQNLIGGHGQGLELSSLAR